VNAFHRCLTIGIEEGDVLSRNSKPSRMRHLCSYLHCHPNDSGANFLHADPCSASYRADFGNDAASATTTLATTADADATNAKRQACVVHERSSPCFCPLCRPHGRRRLAAHYGARAAHRPMQQKRESFVWSPSAKGSISVLVGVLSRHPCRP
jgi:hypothetical protein